MSTFYNNKGKPIAYIDTDGESIFLFDGKPVAYLNDDAVYDYKGEYLGCFKDGWLRDRKGACVFFVSDAQGSGPAKPAKEASPAKSAKKAKPARAAREARPAKPANSLSWSAKSNASFFP